MKKSAAFALFAAAACASPAAPTETPERAAKLGQARELLAAQQYDEALLVTDDLLRHNRADREALLLAAAGSEALADSGRSGAASLLTDAASSLEHALELQPDEPETWLHLAEVHRKASAFEKGRDAAVEAARLYQARRAEADVCRAALAAADNELQLLAAARRPELASGLDPDPATVEKAEAVLRRLEFVKLGLPGPAHARAAQVYQWLGQDLKALDELERGIEAAPGDTTVHVAFQEAHRSLDRRAECAAAYKRLVERAPRQPLLQWFLGRALVLAADEQRGKGAWDAAAGLYAQAQETYAAYRVEQPQHAAEADQWIAICLLSRGRVALESGDLDAARRHFAAAFDACPLVAESDEQGTPRVLDSFGGNYFGGLDQVGRAMAEPNDEAALGQALRYFESCLERHPRSPGGLYNDAAFTAREYGVKVQESADAKDLAPAEVEARTKRALDIWERSYALYCKAVELAPEDPRIVNDCGLMLIYHLHRDSERARALFDRAIALGQAELDALPADASAEQRNFLEEAVGDAYENIAVLLQQQGKPFADYKPFLEKSVKYWRYLQRRAAVMLASGGRFTGPLPGARRAGAASTAAAQDPAQDPEKAKAFAAARGEAQAKADQGDLDGALLVLDGVAATLQGFAPYHWLVGKLSLRYANEAARGGGNAGQIDGLFADAVKHLRLSIEADGSALEPHIDLAQALYDRGDFDAAGDAADDAAGKLGSAASAEQAATVHRIRASTWTRVFVARKQANATHAEALRKARASFQVLEEKAGLGEADLTLWASLEQWAGAPEQALAVLLRAVQRQPDSESLLSSVVEAASSAGAMQKVVDALAGRRDATGLWFRGRARFALAQAQWSGGDFAPAVATLQAGIAELEAAKQANPAFAESADQWVALCLGSKGLVLLSQDKIDEAEEALLAAARKSPSQVAADLGGGNSIKRGILVVADKFRASDMARTERVYRAATEAVPADADFANNHGLFARDLGTALEHEGKEAEAKALFEASYQSYTRAAALEPDSVRLANDRALILIYHLGRELDAARDLLTEAIARGEEQVRSAPPADQGELQSLQEAVGDCWQNLGYYQETVVKDLAAAKASYEKSLAYYPFQLRASAGNLRRVRRALDKLEKAGEAGKGEGPDKDGKGGA